MEIGDYVRTKYGINKIIYIDDIFGSDGKHSFYTIRLDCDNLIFDEEVIKSKPNIIDLIEKKDIIKYHFNGSDYISEVFEYKNDLWVQNENNMFDISEINIKSIVTKEQFEAIKYEIK